jgi:hypothetical protein
MERLNLHVQEAIEGHRVVCGPDAQHSVHHWLTDDGEVDSLTHRLPFPQEDCGYLFELETKPLWSGGQTSWLLTQRSRVRFRTLPDFLSSSGSGTGSTQPLWG